MKKRVFLLALFLALLTACGGEESATESAPPDYVTTEEAARAVADYLGWDDLSPLDQELRDDYLNYMYWLEEGSWTEATIYAAQGADARELVVLRLSDEEYEASIYAAMGEYCKARQGDFFGYFPAQAALVENAVMMTVDGYVALFICDDTMGAADALEAVLNGEEPPPRSTPSPSPTATPAASPGRSPEPVPSAEAGAEPTPTPDVSRFFPFDPPNEFDMSLYDTSAILKAYETGDESGLLKLDRAILARCKEGLEACVTEDMTDFEKELALRDWMLEQGEYDESTQDWRTPQGRPNNTNPYGYLVRGYGICLGYATTFQLLMDLAGVECITVVGAAFRSTGDHAWNMVKLEGEWYCVDVTWDLEGGYRYFNVTSDYMRQTDHQWDYKNIPEATATRFYWNGKGEKPE